MEKKKAKITVNRYLVRYNLLTVPADDLISEIFVESTTVNTPYLLTFN